MVELTIASSSPCVIRTVCVVIALRLLGAAHERHVLVLNVSVGIVLSYPRFCTRDKSALIKIVVASNSYFSSDHRPSKYSEYQVAAASTLVSAVNREACMQ